MADDDAPTCPIEGNSDLYGLGVRLGLYLQFIALVLARPSAKRAFDNINISTIAFVLANFIVLIQQTSSRDLYAPEAYLLFYLLVPQLVVNMFGTELKPGKIESRGIIAILLWGAFCFYFTWFWWVGLDVLKRSTCEDEFGFFFTKVSLRGWFRTFNKVIWTVSCIVFGVAVARYIFHIMFFVSGAETTLRYNNIQGVDTVNSASQLVPLVYALGLLLQVIIETLRKLTHGFRHAFDADEQLNRAVGHDHDLTQLRQELLQERGWFGVVGRFLLRVFCAFAVAYDRAEEEEEEPNQSGPSTGCPKRGQYASVEVELHGGAQP
ncbi:hypothetical protein GGR53DRAFT_528981 [Hypoxylon sp. FL1150]|nr:hypothetical protein GGR53DRAFT_528981 [Hypoxylon sp. FL1150]